MALSRGTGLLLVKSRKPESGAERGGSADEGAAALIKAKEPVGGTRDANTGALAEQERKLALWGGSGRARYDAEPEWAWRAEVGTVERTIDLQGGGKASRTAGEIEQARSLAMMLHLRNALEGLEGSDEDATADSSDFRTDVQHEMVAVAEIDIGVAAAQKHRPIAGGRTAKMVGGGIALWIGFGFHDAPAESDAFEFPDNHSTDQKAGQRDRVRR
jgi:hypothetical protein